jgi:hypothetical protein
MKQYFEVDVPAHHTTDPGRRGLHVFTGEARTRREALRRAHEAVDDALAARTAGHEIRCKHPGGWAARGLRTDWVLDWAAAKAGRWVDPYSWTTTGDPAM